MDASEGDGEVGPALSARCRHSAIGVAPLCHKVTIAGPS